MFHKTKKLNIDNCIILHDVKIIRNEIKDQAKIKTLNGLVKLILKRGNIDGTRTALYARISRAAVDGFNTIDEALKTELLDVLKTTEEELIIEFSPE